jgi:hypothetical protein
MFKAPQKDLAAARGRGGVGFFTQLIPREQLKGRAGFDDVCHAVVIKEIYQAIRSDG